MGSKVKKILCMLSLWFRLGFVAYCVSEGIVSDVPIMAALLAVYVVANIPARGALGYYLCEMKCQDNTGQMRALTKKEAKRCARRFYIIFAMIIANAFWIAILTAYSDEAQYSYVVEDFNTWASCIIVSGLIFDIILIKPKNFKYLCQPFMKTDHDYENAPVGQIEMRDGAYYQAQYYQGQQPPPGA